MEWTPSIAAEISRYGCPECAGTGIPVRRRLSFCPPPPPPPTVTTLAAAPGDGDPEPLVRLCGCVYRAVFRACHRRFVFCGKLDPSLRRISYDRTPRAVDRTLTWVRRNEDYRADFHHCGERSLPKHLYQLFSFYHLHGGKMAMVARRLGFAERRAWEYVVEIERIVGREIAHLQPYSLFPPAGYMVPANRATRANEPLRRAG